MNSDDIIIKTNSFEENRFETISDFKCCMSYRGEVEFEWKGKQYTIVHVNDHIVVSRCCYEKDGRYYHTDTHHEHTEEDELWADTADEILEYRVSGDRLRDVITQVKVWSRTM